MNEQKIVITRTFHDVATDKSEQRVNELLSQGWRIKDIVTQRVALTRDGESFASSIFVLEKRYWTRSD